MAPLVAVVILVAGCAEADPWVATREVCGVDEVFPWSALGGPDPDAASPLAPDDACVDAILADHGGDPEALVHDYGTGASVMGILESDRADPTEVTGLYGFVIGAYWLLGADLGTLSEVEAGPLVDAAFVEELQALAAESDEEDPEVARLLYRYTSRHIHGLAVRDNANPGLAWVTGTYTLSRSVDSTEEYDTNPTCPSEMAAVIVHEGRHDVFGGRDHVACGPPSVSTSEAGCDADLEGAYGFSTAVKALAWNRGACEASFNLTRGLLAAWAHHLLLEPPELPLPACAG